jgi:aspartyl-tRNA(Asn)/glutamyl-tRNA(Gln) amidotransferase subunit A
MQPGDLNHATISDLSTRVAAREVSPREVVDACLARIERLDGRLNSYITVLADRARAEAARAEDEIARGHYRGPLHGMPIAVKDLFQTSGVPTTCGSRIFARWTPEQDATVVRRLREAGAILLGKLNMHEFAFRVPHPDYPLPRNPWNLERSTSGSSSGSGAAVAATLCLGALGSDTGGSIRGPAAYCGIVGLKPTYGLVSRAGVVPLAWTLDHAGPMTKTVEDTAIILDAIAGFDGADPASARRPLAPTRPGLTRDLKGLRVGVPRAVLDGPVSREARAATVAALHVLEGLGMRLEDVSYPSLDEVLAAYRTIVFSEAAAFHQAYFPARADDYSPRMREQLALGLAIPAAQYLQAQRVRRLVVDHFRSILNTVDVVVTPGSPVEAHPIGEPNTVVDGVTHTGHSPASRLTNPFNMSGMPAVTIPCGFSSAGLPLSLQVAGRWFDDGVVLASAHAYERATEWHRRIPAFATL